MSTNYGYQCVDCGTRSIIDNCRSNEVPRLIRALDEAAAVSRLLACGISVVLLDTTHDNGADELRFAVEHINKGHKVVVADEYGRAWGQCGRRPPACPTCGNTHGDCALTIAHDGPCVLEKKKEIRP